jgi:hypothetical protein
MLRMNVWPMAPIPSPSYRPCWPKLQARIKKRCRAVSELGEEQKEMNVARGAIRVFMAVNADGLVKRFVIEDDRDKT